MNKSCRVIWRGRILPGKTEEYIECHEHIWPEMVRNLKEQGISNYSIFLSGDELVGYYECEDFEKLQQVKAASSVAKEWADSMAGIVEIEKEPDGVTNKVFKQIFYLQ